MWRTKIKNSTEKEQGSALVLTLMVLLVLSVLGVSVGMVTVGSYRLSDANRSDTSAYYIAEAGATAVYADIQAQVLALHESSPTKAAFANQVEQLKQKETTVAFAPQFGEEAQATVTVVGNYANGYTIQSTGQVGTQKRSVEKPFEVKWVRPDADSGFNIPGNAAVISSGKVELAGETLQGDVYAAEHSVTDNMKKTGNEIEKNYTIKRLDNIDLGEIKNAIPAPPDEHLQDRTVGNNETWVIDTAEGDSTLFVKKLSLGNNSRIEVRGEGIATLVVEESFTMGNSVVLAGNTDRIQLVIIYKGTAALEFGKGSNSNKDAGYSKALIIAPNAEVTLSLFSLKGTVVAEAFRLLQNADLVYAPVRSPEPAADIITAGPINEPK